MPTVEILSQGDEVVTGQTVDTNAAWLADRLTALGFTVLRHVTVGDRIDDIVQAFHTARTRADFCICTGGLGPTEDDLTSEAIARVYDAPLHFDTVAMAHIEARYARHGRRMPEVNRKQAWLPLGSTRLDNDWGTAPAFAMQHEQNVTVCLPGVPREMKALFDARVLPLLEQHFQVQPGRLITLRTTGVGESTLQERIGTFEEDGVVLSYRTKLPENHIKLRFAADVSESVLHRVVRDIASRIGSPVFCIEGLDDIAGPLPVVVGQTLGRRGATVATAESCTGGQVASELTGVPGSSAWFTEGVVTYSNAAKVRQVGVRPETLEAHGAVSQPVAEQMATGIRERAGTTYGLATTGIAGPGGGSDEKPVGTVHIALATRDQVHHRKLRLGGDRRRIQALSTAGVLDLLRRHLQDIL